MTHRILVVDDESATRLYVQILRRGLPDASEAGSAEEAVTRIAANRRP